MIGIGVGGFFFLIVVVGFGLLVGGMIWLGVVQARKTAERRAALAARMTAKGYQYAAEDPRRTSLLTSSPFGIGDSRRVRDVVWGERGGRGFETFAYSYETSTTDADGNRTTTTHRHQITWVLLPAPLPTMRLTADNALMRMFTKMGAKDLDVESHEFNQRWKVWCADERSGHAVLTPTLIASLLEPGWYGRSLVIEGRLLMTYVTGHTELVDLDPLVDTLFGVVDSIPKYLWEQGQA